MVQVSKFDKAFIELKEIMKYFDNEIKSKIPNDIKELVENINQSGYQFVYDKSLPLYEQNILPETKALLSIIYSDYLCSQIEKEKWDEYDKFEQLLIKEKLKKQEKYNVNDLFKTKTKSNNSMPQEKIELIEYKKQGWYQKFFENIKKIFKKIKNNRI